jgi:hypothetical protein
MAAMSDYLENKLIDQIFRAQAYTFPGTLYVALLTAAPTDAGGGTEVSGNAYARVAVTNSLANWAGTQGAGTTVASSGTTATTSNNGVITFPTPTGTWGTVAAFGIYDASTAGNLLFYGTLTTSKTINTGDTVTFPAASLSIQLDN